jgi:hypothetical protein
MLMGNRNEIRSSLLSRVTFCLAVGAGFVEAAATLVAGENIGFADAGYIVLLAAPFGILAWMSRRYRDRRIFKTVLFLTVLCLAAWGLSHLIDDAWRFHHEPDYRRVQRLAPFVVLCGNWLGVGAMFWAERLLSRLCRRK